MQKKKNKKTLDSTMTSPMDPFIFHAYSMYKIKDSWRYAKRNGHLHERTDRHAQTNISPSVKPQR